MKPPTPGEEAAIREKARQKFSDLDSDADGFLDKSEIVLAFRKMSLPTTKSAIDSFMQESDVDKDGLISQAEFADYCFRKTLELRKAFAAADTDSSGKLCIGELSGAMKGLGLAITDSELDDIFRQLDNDRDGRIDFDEWQKALRYVPYEGDALRGLFKMWHMDGAMQEEVVVPEKMASHPRWVVFCSGAVAGAVSRTLTAPIDRVKVLMQLSGSGASNDGTVEKRSGILRSIRSMYNEGGVRGCFRGNLVNCLKVAPQGAVQFSAFEALKTILPQPDKDNFLACLGHRFVAGASAGVIAQTAVYPLDTIKTRLSAASTGTYNGLAHCGKMIYQGQGAKGFYRGLSASMLGAFPYTGVDLACYETMKTMYINKNQLTEQPNPIVMLGLGTTSSAIGQVCTYPISLVRTRLQAQGMSAAHPVHYSGMIDCFQQIWARKGVAGLYVGLQANLAKAAPAAGISYFVYESMKQFLVPP